MTPLAWTLLGVSIAAWTVVVVVASIAATIAALRAHDRRLAAPARRYR